MLKFEEEGHVYTYNDEVVPSVTQVMAPISNLDGIPEHHLENARQRGTAVHRATELYDFGELGEIDMELEPYLEAWKQFLHCYNPEIIAIERKLFSEKRKYAGTIDRVLKIKRKRTLVDIKATADNVATVGPQTAAYQRLWEENYGEQIQERWSVRLLRDGTFDLQKQKTRSDLATFDHCHAIWKWRTHHYG
jgi:hypothetical protein